MSEFATISVRLLAELCEQEGAEVIDVRTPAEFQELHATVARNCPLDALDPHALMRERGDQQRPLYVICRSGSRSGMACQKFLKAGFENVVSVEGGTAAWEQAGLPVVRGRKVMSLERQVRIAAGFLVLLGVGLGQLNPLFLILSAFVGAGLMFAGITDTCGMGMLLSKMPWNQAGGCGRCADSASEGQCKTTQRKSDKSAA